MDAAADPPGALRAPSLLQLFFGFTGVAVLAFGGVLPWAHYVLVERRRWLTNEDFTDTLALCQIVPGPNIVNMSIVIGARFQGGLGSLAAVLGLLTVPIAVVLVLAGLYGRYGGLAAVQGALAQVAAAAAGLIVAMAIKLARPLLHKRALAVAPLMAATFVAIGILRWPLWPVIAVLAPVSIAVGWRMRG
jgi:chromate transporter